MRTLLSVDATVVVCALLATVVVAGAAAVGLLAWRAQSSEDDGHDAENAQVWSHLDRLEALVEQDQRDARRGGRRSA